MKPNRITLHIPSGLRVVIPEVVVVQAALGVVVLPREAQVHHGVVWATGLAVAEGVGLPLPGQARPGAGHRVAIEGNEAVAVAGVAVAVLLGFAVGQARGALFGAVAHGVEP